MKDLSFFQKIELIVTHPHRFFEKIKAEKGISKVFGFYFIFVFAICIINTLFMLPNIIKDQIGISFGKYCLFISMIILFILLFSLAVALSSFVMYWILHLLVIMFNGKQKFSETYKLLYAAAPLLIVALIPYYGAFKIIFYPLFIIAGLDAGYIELIGMQKLQKMSRLNALSVVGIAALLGIISLVLIIKTGSFSL